MLYAQRWIRKKRQEAENLTVARGNRLQGCRAYGGPFLSLGTAKKPMNIEPTVPSEFSFSAVDQYDGKLSRQFRSSRRFHVSDLHEPGKILFDSNQDRRLRGGFHIC